MDHFMFAAVEEARATLAEGGRPYGALLVRQGQVIGAGRNRTVQNGDPTSHAEIEAIRAGGIQVSYEDTVMYATAPPCLMCAGAIASFEIPKVVVGASWPGTEDALDFMRSRGIEVNVLESEECRQLLAG
jgi:creatinine deaminase